MGKNYPNTLATVFNDVGNRTRLKLWINAYSATDGFPSKYVTLCLLFIVMSNDTSLCSIFTSDQVILLEWWVITFFLFEPYNCYRKGKHTGTHEKQCEDKGW